MIRIYTDGACRGNPGPGGWAAVIEEDGQKKAIAGREKDTTNNRMEMLAAIKGLEATPEGAAATVFSDSQYLVNTMTKGWKRRANQDLWARLDGLTNQRRVKWEWVRGHAGHPGNEEADALANKAIGRNASPVSEIAHEEASDQGLTHLDAEGQAQMVDVGHKPETERVAVAKGSVVMKPQTLDLIRQGRIEKGDTLTVARIAGINAAKRTWELIPLCHQVPLSHVAVDMEVDPERSAVHITAAARSTARTGVEMEALTAVAVAGLTIYDMCKTVDRGMRLQDVRLVRKSGGKSGDIVLEE